MIELNKSALGLYVHIPFCRARCGYCDFVTFTGKEDRIDQYVNDLCSEIRLYDQRMVSTIFFGGGTPSLLSPAHVRQILQTVLKELGMTPDAEVTMEANPESITFDKAKGWREAGVNRLSIGLQVFDDVWLKKIGRLHTVAEFLASYKAARAAGFKNVNIDLIYGFAEQSLNCWQDTVGSVLSLVPEHVSLYSLAVEDHTPFDAQGITVDEDIQASMYEWVRPVLVENGYQQYEISNFSRPGYECRHNLVYWRQEDYLGVGVGAVGCVNGLRWENHKNLNDFGRDVKLGKFPRYSTDQLDPCTRKFERLMLGLRLREGIDWTDETDSSWLQKRAHLAERRLLEEIRPGIWRVTDHAVVLTNQVLLPFMS